MGPWLDRVRRRAPAIVALAAVAVSAAAVYSFTGTKRYEARAELLVSPLPASDRTFRRVRAAAGRRRGGGDDRAARPDGGGRRSCAGPARYARVGVESPGRRLAAR